jgi:hypothetical protein
LKISESETDKETERPISSVIPKIISVDVCVNPFDDIVVRHHVIANTVPDK